jgi:hypothetical protein
MDRESAATANRVHAVDTRLAAVAEHFAAMGQLMMCFLNRFEESRA